MTPPPLSRIWSRDPPAPLDDQPPQAGPSNSRFKMPKFKIDWGKRAPTTQGPAVDGGINPSGLYDEQQPAGPPKSRLGKLKLKRRKRDPVDIVEQEPPPFVVPDDFADMHPHAAPVKSRFRVFKWGRAKRAQVDQVEADRVHVPPSEIPEPEPRKSRLRALGIGRHEPPPEDHSEPPPIDHHDTQTDYAPSQFGMLYEPLVVSQSHSRRLQLRNRKRSTASLGRKRHRFPKLRHMDEESKIVEGHGFLRHASDQIHQHRRSLGSRVASLDARWAELFTVAPVVKKLTKGRQRPDEWNENARQLLKDVEKSIRDAHRRSGGGSILSFIRLGSVAGTIRPRIQPAPRRPASRKPRTAPSSVAPSFYVPSERSELNHNISTRYPKNLRPKYGGSSSVMSLLTDDYPPSRAPLPSIVGHRRERQRPSPPKSRHSPHTRPTMAMIPEQGVPQMIPERGITPQYMSPPQHTPSSAPFTFHVHPPSASPSVQSELPHRFPDADYNPPKPRHTSDSARSRTYKAGTPEKMRRRSREKIRDRERPRDYPREKSDYPREKRRTSNYPREKYKTTDYPREKYRTSDKHRTSEYPREKSTRTRDRERERHHRPRDRSRSRSRERHRRERSRSRERRPRDRSRSRERERSSRHRGSSRERRRSRSRDRHHRSRRSSPHRRR
ncbi:hypothetical protein CPB85DRAFT_171126 [Mucidula mucida]|nr:hypothetical protein CPB85DRAFT_171126 [Mucidula mucida]